MKKIVLGDYEVEFEQNGLMKKMPFAVKESLVSVLFVPDLKLNGRDLLLQNILAEKIENCKEDFILLESEEYSRLVSAINVVRGFGKNDIEFIRRILEAENVEVEEKK